MKDIKSVNINGHTIYCYEVDYIKNIKGLYGFIYITTNLINGKMYVGQRRFIYKNGKGWENYLGSGTYFKRAVKKYGKENFHRIIIDIAFNQNELNYLENFYTRIFDSVNNDQWYNLCCGGGTYGLNLGNKKWRPVERYTIDGEKIGEYKSINEGDRYTGDGRQSILSCCNGDRPYIVKSNTVWRYKGDDFEKFPVKVSRKDEKEVKCYNKFQEFIAIYKSTHEAERQTGVDHSSIIKCCNRDVCLAGDFIWCYKNDSPIYNYENMSQKPVYQYDLNGKYINRFISTKEAGLSICKKHININKCCNKKIESFDGYKWYYVNDQDQPDKTKILYSNI